MFLTLCAAFFMIVIWWFLNISTEHATICDFHVSSLFDLLGSTFPHAFSPKKLCSSPSLKTKKPTLVTFAGRTRRGVACRCWCICCWAYGEAIVLPGQHGGLTEFCGVFSWHVEVGWQWLCVFFWWWVLGSKDDMWFKYIQQYIIQHVSPSIFERIPCGEQIEQTY